MYIYHIVVVVVDDDGCVFVSEFPQAPPIQVPGGVPQPSESHSGPGVSLRGGAHAGAGGADGAGQTQDAR